MINIQIEILELFPSVNEIIENKDENIILIIIIKGIQNIFNLNDIIEEKIPISLKIKEIKTLIQLQIYKNEFLIGEVNFFPFNETKWLTVKYSKKYISKNKQINHLIDSLKIKMKCSLMNEALSKMKNNIIKKNKLFKKSNLFNKANLLSSPRETESNRKNSFHTKTLNDNKYHKRKSKILLHNKSCEEYYFSHNIIYSQSNQISMDDSMQLNNNPLCNSTSGTNHLRRKSLDENNNKIIKRLNSQDEKNIKNRKNNLSENKNNLTNNKTTTLSTRDSKEILKNNNNYNYNNNNNHNNNNNCNSINNNNIIRKLDDNFKSIDETIIDKEFEEGIALDELINSNNNNKLMKINLSTRKKINDCSLDSVSSFNFEKAFNKDSDDDEEEVINCNFENLKSDFEIFYTDEYLNKINDDVIELEIQLLLEKIFEMQSAYHLELGILRKKYLSANISFFSFSDKFIVLNKKLDKLKQKNKKIELIQNKNSFVDNNYIKTNNNIIQSNKDEFDVWKKMFSLSQRKKKIFEIFNKTVLLKINNRKNHLDNFQKFICDNFIKRYKIKGNNNDNLNDNKNLKFSPIQFNRTNQYFNNNSSNKKNNLNNQKQTPIKSFRTKSNTNK